MKTYVTFGQSHTHKINGKVFDKDCIAIVEGNHETVLEIFGDKFCFEYQEADWDENRYLPCFPRGYMAVNIPDEPSTANHIQPNGFFHTPTSLNKVQEWVAIHNREEQAHLTIASMMTYNLLTVYYNKAVRERNEVIQDLLSIIEEYSANEQIIIPRIHKSISDLRNQYRPEALTDETN